MMTTKNFQKRMDRALEDLLLNRLERKKIDLDNSDDAAEFFDEEFPEYEENNETLPYAYDEKNEVD
ncbi:hypothetical protein ACVRW7_05455 [Streptococcus ratti]|uniref:Uncharacterized protein n=1 Tax=Streptococcus ratti FA-1 = DSM 20564 TaxID=699248 RepID=A0ABP2R019_STRRT|nr:hypothetical protein [Streptococcus ratti]EJN94645.1 hypothetical protein SRA_08926 [Streptococcus ratti FA-1 = DSM 20564]EMP69320.1 hypothetical protein D822_08175 [Streptococcus ratti FA-1 = DSM 20564]QEY06569.1 hypothetical protein FY406_02185 [Streptococcus ratti]VEI60915.1 Uncharacterised protein [Streptococcus mutans]